MDLLYKNVFSTHKLPHAYERLILEAAIMNDRAPHDALAAPSRASHHACLLVRAALVVSAPTLRLCSRAVGAQVFANDHSHFVSAEEIGAAWRILTPALDKLEATQLEPHLYPFGSRGPPQADELAKRFGMKKFGGAS